MRKTKDYTILALFIPFSLAILANLPGCYQSKQKPVDVQYFKAGDILYPDYVCSDTLIVVNAAGLNNGMAYIEQGLVYGTDRDIDSILHSNCILK